MLQEEKRKTCPHCNGFGGKLKFVTVGRKSFSVDTKVERTTCPVCWGRGYLDCNIEDAPDNEQSIRYLMYP